LSVEDDFHENRVDVIVATVAFGMGVDKPDIRWVYHADLPPSIDAYYQEIGRSGRDGGPARAVLYYRPEDVRLPRMYASRAGPSANALRAVAGALAGGARSLEEVMDKTGLRRTGATSGIETLSGTGAITLDAAGTINLVSDLQEGLDAALSLVARRRQMERTRVDTMQAYAETLTCRRRFILEYFGEPCADACRNCDNHESTLTASRREVPFPRGSRVEHSVFGPGQILGYAGEEVLISFAEAGYRRLDLGLVEENDLLRLQEGGSRRRDEL
jgi:ATP-dependent DNA helicase RecQ